MEEGSKSLGIWLSFFLFPAHTKEILSPSAPMVQHRKSEILKSSRIEKLFCSQSCSEGMIAANLHGYYSEDLSELSHIHATGTTE